MLFQISWVSRILSDTLKARISLIKTFPTTGL